MTRGKLERSSTPKWRISKWHSIVAVHVAYIALFSFYISVTQLSLTSTTSGFDDGIVPEGFEPVQHRRRLRNLANTEDFLQQNSDLPTCAKGLSVQLLDDQDNFLCKGVLLRDDLVLADKKCTNAAQSVLLLQPDHSFLLTHRASQGSRMMPQRQQILSRKIVDDVMGLVEIEMPQVHYQSGWPRKRLFVLENSDSLRKHRMWNSAMQVLQLARGRTVEMLCSRDDQPVIALPISGEQDIEDMLGDVLLFPFHHEAAYMSNMLGERWWVPREEKSVLTKQLFARRNLYTSDDEHYTLDVFRAMGDQAILEAEDPKTRLAECLWGYYEIWKQQEPFSGEPFFQWLDFGSGRAVTTEECDREWTEDNYGRVMDDKARSKSVVVPEIVDGEVILQYEEAGLPVEGGHMLFVWGLDNKLYVHQDRLAKFHHMCFLHAKPVRMAGEIVVGKHGVLQEISPASGHYKPTDWHYKLFYRYLKSKLPELSPDMIVWKNEHTKLAPEHWLHFLFSP